MSYLQTAVQEALDAGLPGQIGTGSPAVIDAEHPAGGAIPFGYAAKWNATDSDVEAGVDGSNTVASNYVGIAVRDRSRRAPASGDAGYVDGDIPSLMTQGDVWVEVEAAVAVGNDVTVKDSTGQLSSAAASATQTPLNGRWMTAAAADGIALVRLTGQIA